MKLDLGSGRTPKEGFTGVDLHGEGDVLCLDLLLGSPWPFPEASVEELTTSHFIEHIDNAEIWTVRGWKDALVWFMEESFRILQPGGVFTLQWPAYQDPHTNELMLGAFMDPTHRRFIPPELFHYFTAVGRKTLKVSQYDIQADFTYRGWNYQRLNDQVGEYTVLLQKPVPSSSPEAP